MSSFSIRKFKCMKCDKVYEIKTYDSISFNDTDLKERCLSGDIFQYECPFCHETYMLSYPCLYVDSDKKFMVYLCDEEFISTIKNKLYDDLHKNGYILRRCNDINSFIEKIQILDDLVDDRAVEFAKYDSYIDYINNKKGDNKEVTGIYYHGLENDILKINIKLSDKGLTIMIPYTGMLEEIDSHKNMFAIDDYKFPCIDSKWIIDIFNAANSVS